MEIIEILRGNVFNFIFFKNFRALLKSEVEAAINGKQWLLSCFGPFKESAVLPNFIPDRSFEEVRMGYLEAAKTTGGTQQHVNELINQYNDAMTKLSQLKMATPDTINLIANIYNQSVQQDQSKPAAAASTNVFSLSNASNNQPQHQQNPFQMGGVFGATQQQQSTAMNAGSIFGGTTNSNPFQSPPQNSIFGAPMEPAPSAASSFTFSLGQQATQQSIFGSAPQPAPQSSIFGSSQPVQQAPGASIFGAQSNNFGSMFATSPTQQQPQPLSFASTNPAPSGIFGAAQQAPQSFAAPTGNVFNQFQPQAIPQPANTGNIFAQPSAVPTQNPFGIQTSAAAQQPPLPPTGSIFQIQQQNPNPNPPQSFGGNPFQTQQPPVIDESVYSRPEDLTPDELQAFQADMFQLGSIPLRPPPKQLC